jgi:hypothetical protein
MNLPAFLRRFRLSTIRDATQNPLIRNWQQQAF